MNKSIYLLILASFTVFISLSFISLKKEGGESRLAQERNDLPNIKLTLSDSSKIVIRNLKGKIILVFFNPDCEHCQVEAKEISKHVEKFKRYNLYFISTANFADIKRFSKESNLTGKPNIHFARTTISDITQSLGYVSAPSLYIYSKESQLVKAFQGETAIAMILPYL